MKPEICDICGIPIKDHTIIYVMSKKKHICNPEPVDFFGRVHYQCGCGRYFGERKAIEQKQKYLKHISDEFKEEEKKDETK